MMGGKIILFAIIATLGCAVNNADGGSCVADDIAKMLDPIRLKHQLPAMGGAVVDSSGLKAMAVVGVRKHGTTVNATTSDLWHIGSCLKAITATMVAALVERGNLSWDTTLGSVYPDLKLPEPISEVTPVHLLSHRSGLPANAPWGTFAKSGSLVEQRRAVVALLNSTELLAKPGSKYIYSNWGYVVAGAMAEQVTGMGYEDLMTLLVFEPLQMESVGYGPTGPPGKVDQPWGHTAEGIPVQLDNFLVMAPAGTVHLSLSDWSKFIADQLRGAEGMQALLKPESYVRLHTAPLGEDYALGWVVLDRPWGGGRVLAHSGSNTVNYAVVWMAPLRDFAVLVVVNQDDVSAGFDQAADGLIICHLKP